MSRGGHGAYRTWWLCVTCGFGINALHWRHHRKRCLGLPKEARCPNDCDWFPCRKKRCPLFEKPQKLPDAPLDEPGIAPRAGVVKSLGMTVGRTEDGRWTIRAAWLDGPVIENTWPEAYWAAVRAK